jgi:hypothetical protein
VVTVTSTVPADPAGDVTPREVPPPFTTTFVPEVVPNFTAVAPVRLVPVTVTDVPPPLVPVLGVTAVTVGTPKNVKLSAALVAVVPDGVTTVTSTVPAGSAGETIVIDVAELTTRPVPGVAPKLTAVAPVKLVPVTVTVVPPAIGPAEGLTLVTVAFGGGTRSTPTASLTCDTPWEDTGEIAPGPTDGL